MVEIILVNKKKINIESMYLLILLVLYILVMVEELCMVTNLSKVNVFLLDMMLLENIILMMLVIRCIIWYLLKRKI